MPNHPGEMHHDEGGYWTNDDDDLAEQPAKHEPIATHALPTAISSPTTCGDVILALAKFLSAATPSARAIEIQHAIDDWKGERQDWVNTSAKSVKLELQVGGTRPFHWGVEPWGRCVSNAGMHDARIAENYPAMMRVEDAFASFANGGPVADAFMAGSHAIKCRITDAFVFGRLLAYDEAASEYKLTPKGKAYVKRASSPQ